MTTVELIAAIVYTLIGVTYGTVERLRLRRTRGPWLSLFVGVSVMAGWPVYGALELMSWLLRRTDR